MSAELNKVSSIDLYISRRFAARHVCKDSRISKPAHYFIEGVKNSIRGHMANAVQKPGISWFNCRLGMARRAGLSGDLRAKLG
jgi:hypothetical protein